VGALCEDDTRSAYHCCVSRAAGDARLGGRAPHGAGPGTTLHPGYRPVPKVGIINAIGETSGE